MCRYAALRPDCNAASTGRRTAGQLRLLQPHAQARFQLGHQAAELKAFGIGD